MNKATKNSNISGFTLIEMAVVLVVIGVLIVTFLGLYRVYDARERVETTRRNMELIKIAINDFYEVNGRMPCPARMDLAFSDPNFGVETNCAIAAPGGIATTTGRIDPVSGAQPIRIGALPVKTIMQSIQDVKPKSGNYYSKKIGIKDIYDRWGGLLRYVVSTNMAISPNMYTANDGAIKIIDANGNDVTNPASTIVYAIISHGKDKFGAVTSGGNVGVACPAATVPDNENCDNDGILRNSLLVSTNAANNLDDIVAFSSKRLIAQPVVSSFKTFTMDCTLGGVSVPAGYPYAWNGANPLGEQCGTVVYRHDTVDQTFGSPSQILPGVQLAPGETPKDGVLLHSINYTPGTSGRLIIRAVIPIRHIGVWNNAIMGAIYLDDTLVQTAEVMNPGFLQDANASHGGTGVILGVANNVQAGANYTVKVFLYDQPGAVGFSSAAGNITYAGSIKVTDHSVDGVVEIMEAGR